MNALNYSIKVFGLFMPLILSLAAIAYVNDLFYVHCIVGLLSGFIIGGLIRVIIDIECSPTPRKLKRY